MTPTLQSSHRRSIRRLAALVAAVAILAPAARFPRSVPTMYFEGRVSAQDWNTDEQNDDEIQLYPWPSSRPSWTASEFADSTGPTGTGGVGTYEVRSQTFEDASATFDGANLSSLAIETNARVEVAASGCDEGDRLCVASGHARTEMEATIVVVETADIRISGVIVSSVGNPSPDDSRCELEFYGLYTSDIDYTVECSDDEDASGTFNVSFEATLSAGSYALSFLGIATSNAYSFRAAGFAEVAADLRLDIGAPVETDVDFDWTAPDGFGFDDDASGLVDYYEPDGPLEAARDRYPIDFEASDSEPCDTSRERTWLIDGVAATGDAADIGPCTLTYQFPAEGVHDVTLEVRDASDTLLGTKTEQVVVQDWLIVSIGDSVASGEGNPDIATIGPTPETWQDQQCHRTAIAGPAEAAALLERADPKTSVTFIHLACSGATIASGLIGPYTGVEEGVALPPQLDDLEVYTAGREIDAITVSIGANDVRFSELVKMCLKQADCSRDQPGKAAHLFGQKVSRLPGWYADLQNGFLGRQVDPSRVFITQYFDPLRDDARNVCPSGTVLGDVPVVGSAPLSWKITHEEASWASTMMLVRLDSEVRNAATSYGWNFVGGIQDPYRAHGYCAFSRWVVKFSDSMVFQGDPNGALHPNAPGHELYGNRIADELTADLYEDGDLTKPRPPAD